MNNSGILKATMSQQTNSVQWNHFHATNQQQTCNASFHQQQTTQNGVQSQAYDRAHVQASVFFCRLYLVRMEISST